MSGFYGILKPFDGVTPYRLEMQSRLGGELDSLYDFWGASLAEAVFSEDSCILNLASREYSKCISAYLKGRPEITFITCVFGELVQGRVIEKGTLAKMARGEMTRFLARRGAEGREQAEEFDGLGYSYSKERSDESRMVFLK